jgi:hypothetical protein
VTIAALARRAARDALALAGPDQAGGGFMVTTEDSTLFTGERLALAREALAILRSKRRRVDAVELAELVTPRIRAIVSPVQDPE